MNLVSAEQEFAECGFDSASMNSGCIREAQPHRYCTTIWLRKSDSTRQSFKAGSGRLIKKQDERTLKPITVEPVSPYAAAADARAFLDR